jgi:hypothetical protein
MQQFNPGDKIDVRWYDGDETWTSGYEIVFEEEATGFYRVVHTFFGGVLTVRYSDLRLAKMN